jgi:hypothetical protein
MEIRTSDLRFMKRSLQSIELPLRDNLQNSVPMTENHIRYIFHIIFFNLWKKYKKKFPKLTANFKIAL